jgi:hypothetical protein
MNRLVRNVALTVGMAVLREVVRTVRHRRAVRRTPLADSRWLAVTVGADPDRVAADARVRRALDLPGLQVRIKPARGGRWTEIAARPPAADPGLTSRIAGNDPRQIARRALRHAKSLIETGEVLRTEPTRPRTRGGKLIDAIARRSGGEGRL